MRGHVRMGNFFHGKRGGKYSYTDLTRNAAVHFSAVHRSRRAGAGVLTYFAGAGAGVCSPPVKL